MAATLETLHSADESYGRFSTGILPSHVLKRLLEQSREITAAEAFGPGQIQPSSINQPRRAHGSPRFSDTALRRLHEQAPLVAIDDGKGEPNIDDGLALSIDLKGSADVRKRIGFRAKKHTGLIDVDKVGALDPADFWEPIQANSRGDMVLDPDEFYILVSRERVAIPPDHAAAMVPFNP